MVTKLTALPNKPTIARGHTIVLNSSWLYLESAHASVQAILDAFDDQRAKNMSSKANAQGTLLQSEQELLRSAIVLTSSGLDATMGRLVKIALPRILNFPELMPSPTAATPIASAATAAPTPTPAPGPASSGPALPMTATQAASSAVGATSPAVAALHVPPVQGKGSVLGTGHLAQKKYRAWIGEQVGTSAKPPSELLKAIVSSDPSGEMQKVYVRSKTAASYQGSGDLKERVRDILGIASSAITDGETSKLNGFFQARNDIVHRMDYQDGNHPSRTRRNPRSVPATLHECNQAFQICARFIAETCGLF